MALIKAKPTSPGRRFVVSVKTPGLHKGKPFAGLIEKKSKTGGVIMVGGSLHVT